MNTQYKRFMVLSFPDIHLDNGMRELATSFHTFNEAQYFVEDRSSVRELHNWDFEIFDLDEGQVVYQTWKGK